MPKKKSKKKIPTAIVEVSGGVAYVTKVPRGFRVGIIDYDNGDITPSFEHN